MTPDLEKVAAIIRAVAAEEILPRWRNLGADDVAEKTGPDDLVTVADKASEDALSRQLLSLYPGTFIVGEESVESEPGRMDLFSSDETLWVIDPIDGTMAFSKGQPSFDVMIACVRKRELLAGWVYAPVDDDFYMGEKGSGVWRMNKGISAALPKNQKKTLPEITGILGKKMFSESLREQIKAKESRFNKFISTICAGHDYARILRGEAQCAVYNKIMPWDHLPGLMMASELGFHYAKWDGSPYLPGDTQGGLLISPTRESWQEIKEILFGS